MKYIKSFENISGSRRNKFLNLAWYDGQYKKPEIGDYVFGDAIELDYIRSYSKDKWNRLVIFLDTHIGKVFEIYNSAGYGETCKVKFDDDFDGTSVFLYQIDNIKFFSKNKKDVEEDAELYLATKKYNL